MTTGDPPYQPTSRRPIANALRRTAGVAVRAAVRWGIHPDAISYASIAASLLAAACFWQAGSSPGYPWLLLIAPAFCYLRLWFNMLDGMVALASGKASRRGEILNDLPDRISDVAIFVGVAHSGLCSPFAGYWAAIFALLTAYVGTLGQAVGARREFSGLMSKPWRMVWLHVGAWFAFALTLLGQHAYTRFGGLTVLDWTCLIVVAGCVETIWVRLSKIMATLERRRGDETSVDK